jgi:DNA-binding CsgD family transcriptional regulator
MEAVALNSARLFSEALSCIHGAASGTALLGCLDCSLGRLFPEAGPEKIRAWKEVFAQTATASLLQPAPLEIVQEHLLLELLWPHLVQSHARLRGETPVSATTALPGFTPPDSLTAREREVLRHIALGQTDATIGRALGISPKTASKHVENILAKLGVETRTAAVGVAYAGVKKQPGNARPMTA